MNRLHVLVADRDSKARGTLRARLMDCGYRVTTVGTGDRILRRCEIDPPDVLVVDVALPDMDGYELCERLRTDALAQGITVILLTEPPDDLSRTYAEQMVEFAGADFFLGKPYDPSVVLQLIDAVRRRTRPAVTRAPRVRPRPATWPTARILLRGTR